MESFHLPIAAFVALVVSLSALAFTAYDPAMWLYPPSTTNHQDMALATRCDRLVVHYLLSDKPSFEGLVGAMRQFIGREPYGMLLNSTERAFNYNSGISRDNYHMLRGKILLKLGREVEAKESFRSALKLNPENAQARRYLIDQYVRAGSYSMAKKEIEKALDKNLSGDEARHYSRILEKINVSSSSLNFDNNYGHTNVSGLP